MINIRGSKEISRLCHAISQLQEVVVRLERTVALQEREIYQLKHVKEYLEL